MRSCGATRPGARRAGLGRARARPPRSADRGRAAAQPLADEDSILLARDLGPAEIAELELGGGRIVGVALIEGSATAHAAIVACSLGLPMAVAFGTELSAIADGTVLVLDGEQGVLSVDPARMELEAARESLRQGLRRRRALAGLRGLPAETLDGRRITLLCKPASLAEIDAASLPGPPASVSCARARVPRGVGWPTEQRPCGARAAARRPWWAGGDGAHARLRGGQDAALPRSDLERGLALTLAQPDALAAQLRAIVHAGADTATDPSPLVESGEQVRAVQSLLRDSSARSSRSSSER